ncbi:MAG TPA: magnesium transporter CorA family protein [Patescibacteria group bacterium]|jgi:magnesium transporter|nr:magnesium transporter CorA family protein [Patescibacteria group bacterium]
MNYTKQVIQYYRSTPYAPKIVSDDEAHQHGDWIRVERPDEEELALLISIGVDGDIVADALDPNEVPRIDAEDDWTYFITRLPDTDDDFNDFTTPILFAIGRKYLVTVSRDPLGRLWQPFVEKTTVATSDRENLFFAMMDTITKSYESRVARINRQMRAVTNDIHHLDPRDIATLVEHERKLNDYLDALMPTNTGLERIRAGKYLHLAEDDRDLVEDLSVDMEQVIARCKSLLRTITNVRDSYRAVMDTRLNETMRILTVATLAITIPTMLAGLYGMNVPLPGANSQWLFMGIVGVSVVAAAILVYYFIRRR